MLLEGKKLLVTGVLMDKRDLSQVLPLLGLRG